MVKIGGPAPLPNVQLLHGSSLSFILSSISLLSKLTPVEIINISPDTTLVPCPKVLVVEEIKLSRRPLIRRIFNFIVELGLICQLIIIRVVEIIKSRRLWSSPPHSILLNCIVVIIFYSISRRNGPSRSSSTRRRGIVPRRLSDSSPAEIYHPANSAVSSTYPPRAPTPSSRARPAHIVRSVTALVPESDRCKSRRTDDLAP